MARNRTPNTPIGTCPCPFRGCNQVGDLYRYRAQTDDASKQRRAGKLYMRCPDHGMIQDQEWLLENGNITGASEQPVTENQSSAGESDTTKSPVVEAVPAEPQQPAQEPDPDPEPTPEPETAGNDSGFGFFS